MRETCPKNLIHVGHYLLCDCEDVSQPPPFLLTRIFTIVSEWKRQSSLEHRFAINFNPIGGNEQQNQKWAWVVWNDGTIGQHHLPSDILVNTVMEELTSHLVSSTQTAWPVFLFFVFFAGGASFESQEKSPRQDKRKSNDFELIDGDTDRLFDNHIDSKVSIEMCRLSHDIILKLLTFSHCMLLLWLEDLKYSFYKAFKKIKNNMNVFQMWKCKVNLSCFFFYFILTRTHRLKFTDLLDE